MVREKVVAFLISILGNVTQAENTSLSKLRIGVMYRLCVLLIQRTESIVDPTPLKWSVCPSSEVTSEPHVLLKILARFSVFNPTVKLEPYLALAMYALN